MPPLAPVITSITPDHGIAFGTIAFVIVGSFAPVATAVQIGPIMATITAADATSITGTVSALPQGLYDVAVTNTAATTTKVNFFASTPTTLDARFGQNNGYPRHRLAQLASGALYNRFQFSWEPIEPLAPVLGVHTYIWTTMDATYAQAQADGVTLIAVFAQTPDWAQTRHQTGAEPTCLLTSGLCGIADMQNFYAFAQAAAARYPDMEWEIGNEVTSAPYFEKNDDNPYSSWMRGGFAAIKAGNPDAVVYMAGLVDPRGIAADILDDYTVDLNTDHSYPIAFHIYDDDDDVTQAAAIMLGQQRKKEVVHPFAITETAKYCDSLANLATMAAQIVKRHCRGFSAGAVYVFHWQLVSLPLRDEDAGTAFPGSAVTGLGWSAKDDVTQTFHGRDALAAYIAMTSKISGWTEIEALSETAYRYTVHGRDVWVAWGSGSLPSEIVGKIRVTSHLGVASETIASAVTLTDDPIYVELIMADRRTMRSQGSGQVARVSDGLARVGVEA